MLEKKDMHLELVLVSGEVMDEHRSWPVEPKDKNAPYLFQFLVRDGTDLPEAMRAAAADYLRTEDGRAAWYGRNDDGLAELDGADYEPFSPKAFWDEVPDDILSAHGLVRLSGGAAAPVAEFCTDAPVARFSDTWDGYRSDFEKERYDE